MVHTNETGSLGLTILCDLFNDCDGEALYNFGLPLLQKPHSMIMKFKTSSELVKQCKLIFCLDARIFINKKSNKVQLLADARQKSYE